jgi:L-ascorbate metabolism protein UlaG (beta-lactamase superfamily)
LAVINLFTFVTMIKKQFGGKITQQWKQHYGASPNWKDGVFQNLEQTQTVIDWRKIPGIVYRQLKGHKQGYPAQELPVVAFNSNDFFKDNGQSKFIWYGHSVVLMRLANKTILIDPMLGDDASPVAPTKIKRFSTDTLNIIDTLPEIDLILLTHDHYDHLDYASIQKLKSKTKKYGVALGLKRHLISWGIEADRITEFDWWQDEVFDGIKITYTPTRHFSGRGLSSIARCLWGGWALKTEKENIWFSGDGGYGKHFNEIGKRLGPFDFAWMECGQYCVDWHQIHMFPEESVQAAMDAGVKVAMPVHWAGFNLSYQHAWYEPADAFVHHAQLQSLPCITPEPGKIFQVNSATVEWWKKHL